MVGKLVRRKAEISIDEFIREEICRPLGVGTDFQLGCRKEDWGRVAPVMPPPGPSIQEVLSSQAGYDPDSIVVRTLCNPSPRAKDANTVLWRSSVLGSVNDHRNARALVKILSCYLLGGTCAGGDHRLLIPETVELALTEHAKGTDLVTGRSGRRGLGIYLTGPGSGIVEDQLPDGRVGWGSGWGRSIVVMDCDRRLTITYTMNRMLNTVHPSPAAYIEAIYNVLGVTLPSAI